ncbi:MAG: DUF4387 domain-containing protein [Marmoricola sp.]|nr:DUF4387 domain-containing protein [Marmoricola sp.]
MSETRPLSELAPIIRSKNAKPFRVTFDVLFDREDVYGYVKRTGALNEEAIARAYRVPRSEITSSFVFDPGLAFKFTMRRPRVQGSFGDGDLYACQWHSPMLDIRIPWGPDAPSLGDRALDGSQRQSSSAKS